MDAASAVDYIGNADSLVLSRIACNPIPNWTTNAWDDIDAMQALIDEALMDEGEVLFIQHRHLLTALTA